MIYKSNNSKYTNMLIGHFMRFIEEYKLFGKDESLLIAVSGGIDSMVLAYCLNKIQSYGYSNGLRIVHINHNSRTGQDAEERFVKEFSSSINVECITAKLQDLDPERNFEYKARLKRYDSFYAVAKPNEKIVLAHHIDDSFEWTMLQSLRSSSIEGQIGIPVVNNRVIRPFMCLTKNQICRYASYLDIPFIEDPTNEEIKYERNFIRNNVISAFSDRYQKYLKHYVYRHNEIARRLGVHLLNKNKSSFHISYEAKSVLIYSTSSSDDFSGIENLILDGLKHLNKNSRGSVASQIKNIVIALKNNKFGPVSLTNGIKAYLDFNMVLLTKEEPPKLELHFVDYKKLSYDEFVNFIKDYIRRNDTHLDFPFFVLVQGSRLDRRNFNTTFNVDAINSMRANGENYYPAMKLLRVWLKKKNRHRVLRLNILSRS
jgi:tRNA(Ile)-lysidine synthetase-like protein